MSGGPSFRGEFTGHFVFAGRVENGDAELAVGVNIGMAEGAEEAEFYCAIVSKDMREEDRVRASVPGGE